MASQPIKTLLGPGTKRARGTDEQIQRRFEAVDFALARDQWGFDSAPPAWMDAAIELGNVDAEHSVLVPCAGQGWLADRLQNKAGPNGLRVLEVQEREPALRELLKEKGYRVSDLEDFLGALRVDAYDRIFLFPPHHRGREADYLRMAYRMLAPHGRLVALVSDSVFFHSRPECQRFRNLFRTLRRVGRAGFKKLEDEDEPQEPGGQRADKGPGQPEDGQGSPVPEPEPAQNLNKSPALPCQGAASSKPGKPSDNDGEGGMAFDPGLESPFFSVPSSAVQSTYRPDPGQGRFWRLVWMDRGQKPFLDEVMDEPSPFAADSEPLVRLRMRSRSVVPSQRPQISPPPAQGGLQPSAPVPSTVAIPVPDDEAELELELELIRMRIGPQPLYGIKDRRKLTLAKARLKLGKTSPSAKASSCTKPKKSSC